MRQPAGERDDRGGGGGGGGGGNCDGDRRGIWRRQFRRRLPTTIAVGAFGVVNDEDDVGGGRGPGGFNEEDTLVFGRAHCGRRR